MDFPTEIEYRMVVRHDDGSETTVVCDPTSTLAQYNAERSRGIMHTPEWRDAMARLQQWYDVSRGEKS